MTRATIDLDSEWRQPNPGTPFAPITTLDAANPTLDELKTVVDALLVMMHTRYGHRSSCIIMLGVPIEGSCHDRFATNYYGPCLVSRGLLQWGEGEVARMIKSGEHK